MITHTWHFMVQFLKQKELYKKLMVNGYIGSQAIKHTSTWCFHCQWLPFALPYEHFYFRQLPQKLWRSCCSAKTGVLPDLQHSCKTIPEVLSCPAGSWPVASFHAFGAARTEPMSVRRFIHLAPSLRRAFVVTPLAAEPRCISLAVFTSAATRPASFWLRHMSVNARFTLAQTRLICL